MGARENFVSIEGNLAANPELRFTTGGEPVTTVTVAYNDRLLVKGEWVDGATSYFDCSVFGRMAEHAVQSLTVGDRVSVAGSLRQRSWADKATGEKRYKIEILADAVSVPLRFAAATVNRQSSTAAAVVDEAATITSDGRTFSPEMADADGPF